MTPKEKQCMEEFRKLKIERLRKKIRERSFFKEIAKEFSIDDFRADMRDAPLKDRAISFLLFPVVCLFAILLMILFLPFYTLMVLDDWRRLRKVKTAPLPTGVPEEKTLRALWDLYANDGNHSEYYIFHYDDRMDLVKKWVGILYGGETLSELDLDQRLNNITERQIKANRNTEGIHYTFGPPIEGLVNEISKILPGYE